MEEGFHLKTSAALSAPSPRGAELRSPTTVHHSRLGTAEVCTAPGAPASAIWFPLNDLLPSPFSSYIDTTTLLQISHFLSP